MHNIIEMSVIKNITKTLIVAVILLLSVKIDAQTTTEQPILPWEEDFATKWGLNDDIAWMAEDISEFDLQFNDGFRAGIWGLTASAARFYGLIVNKAVDERFNVKKSTEAVAKYMHNLITFHHGDTLAAITMYINTPLVEEHDSLFKRPACSNKHISMKTLLMLDSAYNAKQKTVIVTKPIPFCTIVSTQTDTTESRNLMVIDNAREVMTVEKDSSDKVKPAVVQEEEKATVYYVKAGDTLSRIAKLYGVKVSDIIKWNKLKNDIIRPDQMLLIRMAK